MSSPTKPGNKKTMAYGKVDEYIVLVHNKLAPGDDEWGGWMEFNIRNFSPGSVMKFLIVTEGGAPSAAQRLQLNEKLAEYMRENPKALRSAIVTASTFVRGVVTALSWFHPGYCAFSPAHMDDAMRYLEIPQEFHAEIRMLVKGLQLDIAGPSGVSGTSGASGPPASKTIEKK